MSFTAGWILIGLLTLGWEAKALFNKERGDTLSEHVWKRIGVKGYPGNRRTKLYKAALALFFAWLVPHLFGWAF